MRILLLLLVLSLYRFTPAWAGDTLYVEVQDELNSPVKGVKIQIHHYPPFFTDAKGSYRLYLPEELEMPFDVIVNSKNYEITKFNYYKEGNDLLIKVKKSATASLEEPIVPGSNAGNKKVKQSNNPIHSEPKAQNDLNSTTPLTNAYSSKEEKALTIDSISVSKAYLQYKGDFERIAKEIHKERERLLKANEQIKNEISQITARLDKEKHLSSEERDKLKSYLKKLEAEFEQNAAAFRKSEEQTRLLIQKLKLMLMEKDSLNAITTRKLEIEKGKRIVAEEQHLRSFTIFIIITMILLLIAFSFYIVARKMRKQKSALQLAYTELSEQKKLTEEQNKQLDIFAYKASHDLKGPLKSITALSELAQLQPNNKETSEFLRLIHVCSIKLDQLITDLLIMAKDSKSELSITPVELFPLVKEVLEELQNIDNFKQVNITVSISEHLSLATDRTLLLSIVQNLIENAIKYADLSKRTQTLEIKGDISDTKLLLSFKDNGIGIDPQYHEKVFGSFFRTSRDRNGTGLGLYIVKQNVSKLGGDIKLESESGRGATFTVQLPIS